MGATVLAGLLAVASPDPPPIDRKALVGRHHPVLQRLDAESPLSVGNGEFAFTADVTGLQTFPEEYEHTIPLATLAHWGWHTAPNPSGWSIDRFRWSEFESHGRRVGYADIPGDVRTPEIEWLRANPHRLHLGRIGFLLKRSDGARARPADLGGVEHTLDLWEGVLKPLGVLPGRGVDPETMRRTLDWIWTHWSWPDTWGWDYPMVAMTWARLGDPAKAVDALLLDTPKNRYRTNGHNHQRPGLTVYLPGNGGLLYAVALMAAGWDGAPTKHAPGFPDDGQWSVRFEGLRRAP